MVIFSKLLEHYYNNKYHNTIIYKLYSKNYDKIYIGSTTINLKLRLLNLKQQYQKHITRDYNILFFLGFDDVKIEFIKSFPCENKIEIDEEISKLISLSGEKCLNKKKQNLNQEQKIEKRKIYMQNYYNKNHQQIRNSQQETYNESRINILKNLSKKMTCKCGCILTKGSLSPHLRTAKHKSLIN